MRVTSVKQKIGLFFFGVFLSLLVLEAGLRLGGWVFVVFQERLNRGVGFQDNEFRILCLGESTTALGGENSYPFQLKDILSQRRPDIRFAVINKGMVSKTSADILSQVDEYLQEYRPHLVIAMIGVNDRPAGNSGNRLMVVVENGLRHLRVYHFFELLAEHGRHAVFLRQKKFSAKDKADSLPAELLIPEISDLDRMTQKIRQLEQAILGLQKVQEQQPEKTAEISQAVKYLRVDEVWMLAALGRYHRIRSHFDQSSRALEVALALVPNNYGILVELARTYQEQGLCEKAIPLLRQAIAVEEDSILALMDLGRCYDKMGKRDETYALAQEILRKKNDYSWVYSEVGSWLRKNGYWREAEQFYLRAIGQNPLNGELNLELAEIYAQQKNFSAAENYRRKGKLLQQAADQLLPETARNYEQIVSKVIRGGARLIVMQYPLRRIDPLKRALNAGPRVTFVENRENFMAALKTGKYPDYFSDNFAGDFGHCTRLGNRLIAQQLADVITLDFLQPIKLWGKL